MSVSVVKVFRNNLVTQLEARAGLSGVKVFKYSAGDEAPANEFIALLDASTSLIPSGFGGKYREETTVNGVVYVHKFGAGDLVADDAKDRADDLINEVFQQIVSDPSANSAVDNTEITDLTETNGMTDQGRYCSIEFELVFDKDTI